MKNRYKFIIKSVFGTLGVWVSSCYLIYIMDGHSSNALNDKGVLFTLSLLSMIITFYFLINESEDNHG